jgi:hypothetical protein
MEAEDAGCSMGISHSVQDTHWNVILPDRLPKNLTFTRRAGAQSALGHLEMEHGFKIGQENQKRQILELEE